MPRLPAPFPGKSVIYCTVGWRDIEKKIFDTFQVVPNCSRTPIPKFHTLMLLIHLTFDIKAFLKPATGGDVFFDLFKSKRDEKLKV